MPEEILIIEICERYGWTYDQYLDQPQWFIDTIIQKSNMDSEAQAKADKELQNNRGTKRT